MPFELIKGSDLISLCNKTDKEFSKRLKFRKQGVTIDSDYFIEKSRINSADKLLCWVMHLLGKNWMDKDFLWFFMDRVAAQYNIRIHGLY